jgi:hypothetical protein
MPHKLSLRCFHGSLWKYYTPRSLLKAVLDGARRLNRQFGRRECGAAGAGARTMMRPVSLKKRERETWAPGRSGPVWADCTPCGTDGMGGWGEQASRP